jgi:hypothetical protein
VVLVPGHPVRAEGDDRVRLGDVDDLGEVPRDHVCGLGREDAVGQAQQVVFGDVERGERGPQLVFADRAQPAGRPACRVVGAALAQGRGHADDPVR